MARLDTIGFELNSTTSGVEWDTATGTISSTTVRSGTYAGRANNPATAATLIGFHRVFAASAGNGPFFLRAYVRIATLPGATTTIMYAHDAQPIASTDPHYSVRLTSTGVLKFFIDNAQVGSDSSALNTGQWYRIEMKVVGTVGQNSELYVDGSAVVTGAGNGTSVSQFGVGANLGQGGNGTITCDLFFDDVALNDSTASVQNSYPGTGQVVLLRPAAAGDQANMVRVGTDSGANWSQVSDVTPDDATAYVQRPASTAGTYIDEYAIDSPTGKGLAAADTVNVVQVGARIGSTSAAANVNHRWFSRLKSKRSDCPTDHKAGQHRRARQHVHSVYVR